MLIPSPIVIPLNALSGLDSSTGPMKEHINALSSYAGVFCMEVNGRVTYLSSASNLQRRIARTLARLRRLSSDEVPQQSVAIHCWESGSKLQSSLLLYQLAKQYFPREYLQRVHLRMPWFVALLTRDPFPRLLVTNRIPSGFEPVFGPFARRDSAQLYEQELQSAFLVRRCTDSLDPYPEHPGCIYGEMNQCLRPCQGAVDSARYLSEVTEVYSFLHENGGRVLREVTGARDQAVAAMDFEGAARIHKRLEKLNNAIEARDPVVTDVYRLNGVALVREGKTQRAQIFPMVQGCWRDPVGFTDADASVKIPELEQELRKQFDPASWHSEPSGRDILEDLALFARWYYSSWREGVWVPFTRLDDPPYRKISRSLRAMLKPETKAKEMSLQDT